MQNIRNVHDFGKCYSVQVNENYNFILNILCMYTNMHAYKYLCFENVIYGYIQSWYTRCTHLSVVKMRTLMWKSLVNLFFSVLILIFLCVQISHFCLFIITKAESLERLFLAMLRISNSGCLYAWKHCTVELMTLCGLKQ